MIAKSARREIDRVIKNVWLNEIRQDYGSGQLLREASLQSGLYYHLRSQLADLLKSNHLFLYPEFYIQELKYRADLAIVQMDLSAEGALAKRVTDIAAIIELKFEAGTSQDTQDAIKADLQKLKQYGKLTQGGCQLYFGIIYETECSLLSWLDRRSTGHWANGCVTELNAGYINGVMTFEVNSYNHMNVQNQSAVCQMLW